MILCCNVIDRWDWRRKVTGALEVTAELWDRLGWLGGGGGVAASKRRLLEIASCHPYQKARVQFGGFAAHMDAPAQNPNQHLQKTHVLTSSEHTKNL